MHGSKILAIEYYLPKKKENNKTLKKFNPKLDINRIKEKTGINNRYISSEKETVIDISIKCSNKIFKKFPKKKIDFLDKKKINYQEQTAAHNVYQRWSHSPD